MSLAPLEEIRALPAKSRVGVPVQERLLTEGFVSRARTVMSPGPGRSVFVIEEPELGAGRPDLILVTVAQSSVHWYIQRGLSLTSPAAARVLDPHVSDAKLGISRGYAAALRRDLAAQGWGREDPSRIASLVTDSLAVEAKIRDWRRALQQVARFRRHVHRTAILMPPRDLPAEADRSLDFYGSGFLHLDSAAVWWERQAVSSEPSVGARLWTLELLRRGLGDGTAYRLSAPRN